MTHELAQVNISRLAAPLDSLQLKDFVDGLEPVNAIADRAPGFVWRLQTEDGDATAVRAFEADADGSHGVLTNMSVWASVEALAEFVYSADHLAIMRRRREWFLPIRDAMTALWWVPAGERPTVRDAEEKVRLLRAEGPTQAAFTLKRSFAAPDVGSTAPVDGRPDWLCPA
jgi:hypothetical protein